MVTQRSLKNYNKEDKKENTTLKPPNEKKTHCSVSGTWIHVLSIRSRVPFQLTYDNVGNQFDYINKSNLL